MISHGQLKKSAASKLSDAVVLYDNGRHDSALYLCGYGIELGLKAVITKNLDLFAEESTSHIPSTKREFAIVASLTNHKLEELLNICPPETIKGIKTTLLAEWSLVLNWNPEMRYAPIRGRLAKKEAAEIIRATRRILRYLNRQL